MPTSLLLIAPESIATPVADALRQQLELAVDIAATRRAALSLLHRNDYALILIEDGLASPDSETIDMIYRSAAGAAVLEINLVLANAARIVRQVRVALVRRSQDTARAHNAVSVRLRSELSSTLTGILLQSQLALRQAPPEQRPQLSQLVHLAVGLRDQLRA